MHYLMRIKRFLFLATVLAISLFTNAIVFPYQSPDSVITSEVNSLESSGYGISTPRQIEARKPVRLSSDSISNAIGHDVAVDFICQGEVCNSPLIQTGAQCVTLGKEFGEKPLRLGVVACHDETKDQPVLVLIGDPSKLGTIRDICYDFLQGKATPPRPTGSCPEAPLDYEGILQFFFTLLIYGIVLLGVPFAIWRAVKGEKLKIFLLLIWAALIALFILANILTILD